MLAVGALVAAACGGESEASDAPLPTIGLETEFEAGSISGAADVRAIDAGSVETIVMIGDSITVASTPALEQGFADLGFDDVRIVSQTGKRMALSFGDNQSGAEIAAFMTLVPGERNDDDEPSDDDDESSDDDEPSDDESDENDESGRSDDVQEPLGPDHGDELWIVALGTNDINQYGDGAEVAAAVNEVLAAVPDEAPLIWVDTYWEDQSDGAAEINLIVADRLERRGNAVLAPWSAVAAEDGVMRSDGVHPSTDGTEVFAAVVVRTTADFLDR